MNLPDKEIAIGSLKSHFLKFVMESLCWESEHKFGRWANNLPLEATAFIDPVDLCETRTNVVSWDLARGKGVMEHGVGLQMSLEIECVFPALPVGLRYVRCPLPAALKWIVIRKHIGGQVLQAANYGGDWLLLIDMVRDFLEQEAESGDRDEMRGPLKGKLVLPPEIWYQEPTGRFDHHWEVLLEINPLSSFVNKDPPQPTNSGVEKSSTAKDTDDKSGLFPPSSPTNDLPPTVDPLQISVRLTD